MAIDWTHFTPWASLAGGVLLGVASALFILMNGRILGISGIVVSMTTLPARGSTGTWRCGGSTAVGWWRSTTRGGGSPYGASHLAGSEGSSGSSAFTRSTVWITFAPWAMTSSSSCTASSGSANEM